MRKAEDLAFILPRQSGVSDNPLGSERAIPYWGDSRYIRERDFISRADQVQRAKSNIFCPYV